MTTTSNNYSVAELIDMIDRRALEINRDYQRASGLWPNGARSYFIDTILESFPFPKIYLYEYIDLASRKIRRELVDGQQRLLTIIDFHNNKLELSGEGQYSGCRFDDLSDEVKEGFLSYTVSADVIRNVRRDYILQMFRRMNAYTLPLNEAEKRHSSFYGSFKFFINELSDALSDFFSDFGVLTNRQIVRMGDAEFLTECILALERGVVSSGPKLLKGMYEKYDDEFSHREELYEDVLKTFRFIQEKFGVLRKTHMMKPYAAQTLFFATYYHLFGSEALVKSFDSIEKREDLTVERIQEKLLELARAHETKDIEGEHGRYVWGCLGGTNRADRRRARLASVLAAFGYDANANTNDLAE